METNVNQSKETKGEEEDEEDLQNLRTLLFDIITPLVSLGIDVAKASLLISSNLWEEEEEEEGEFGEVAVYGVTALAIKWTPAAVAALYLQEVRTLVPSLLPYSTDSCYLDLSI